LKDHIQQENKHFKQINIEGCGYQLSEKELVVWLEKYGKIMRPIKVETFEDKEKGVRNENERYMVM
jgi:hypothetical protein